MQNTHKKYSPEFKIKVVETKINESLSSYETAKKFNITINVKGKEYPSHKRVLDWERVYLEKGKEAFYIETRGKSSNKTGRKPKLDPSIEKDLISKCQRLEMENDYLKKLKALVSAREQKEKKLLK